MPVLGRSRVPLLPTNRRPTRRCLSGILFDEMISNPWVSPSQNEPSRKSVRESIRPSRADSQNNRLIGWGTLYRTLAQNGFVFSRGGVNQRREQRHTKLRQCNRRLSQCAGPHALFFSAFM